jgi:hypothetical protein
MNHRFKTLASSKVPAAIAEVDASINTASKRPANLKFGNFNDEAVK